MLEYNLEHTTLVQEAWLFEAFNCGGGTTVFDHGSATEPIKDEEELFESSPEEAECFHSSNEEEECFPTSGSGECVFGSDSEVDQCADTPPATKRARYADRRPEHYMFAGSEVCKGALARLIGVGNSTLGKLRRGEAVFTNSSRPRLPRHPMFKFTIRGGEQALWQNVVMWFWYIYHRFAEVMPTGFAVPGERVPESPFPEKEDKDTDLLPRLVNSFTLSLQSMTSDPDVNCIGPGTFRGAVRYLPHTSRTELYWDYVAYCESKGERAASHSQFFRVCNPILKPGAREGHLRFRKEGDHAQCDQCYSLRQKIAAAKTTEAKASAQRDHQRHVIAQWLDRQIYWSFRSLSQAAFEAMAQMGSRQALATLSISQSVMTCMADGMDQAKYKCPRIRGRFSKTFTKLWRPSLHVSAVWCHGEMISFYVSDADVLKNSSCSVEALSRTIDNVLNRHGTLPHGLSIHCDNTTRESKNQFFMAWASLLPTLGAFRWVVVNYLRVGHSCSVVIWCDFDVQEHVFLVSPLYQLPKMKYEATKI